jgi:hypothetical protein
MTAEEYRDTLATLNLTQLRAADALGISLRTSQAYAIGEYPVPEPVARLLKLMVKLQITPEDVQ